MDPTYPDNTQKPQKSKVYFIVAFVFLMAMALFWSVDDSLVYILLGIACFFLFLAFNNLSLKRSPRQSTQRPYSRPNPADEGSFITGLKYWLNKLKLEGRNQAAAAPGRKTIKIFLIAFVIIFSFPILISILGSNGTDSDAIDYFNMAEQQYYNGQYDSAFLNYRAALRIEPEYEAAMVGYGRIFSIRKANDSAMIMFDNALEINPDNREAVYNKGLIYYEQGKYQEGIDLVSPIIEDNPDYYNAMLLMGDFYYIQKKYDDSFSWYETAYRDGGARGSALCYRLAYLYDTRSDYSKAVPLYQEALNYDSTVVEIYQRLGELLPGKDGDFYRNKSAQLK